MGVKSHYGLKNVTKNKQLSEKSYSIPIVIFFIKCVSRVLEVIFSIFIKMVISMRIRILKILPSKMNWLLIIIADKSLFDMKNCWLQTIQQITPYLHATIVPLQVSLARRSPTTHSLRERPSGRSVAQPHIFKLAFNGSAVSDAYIIVTEMDSWMFLVIMTV